MTPDKVNLFRVFLLLLNVSNPADGQLCVPAADRDGHRCTRVKTNMTKRPFSVAAVI